MFIPQCIHALILLFFVITLTIGRPCTAAPEPATRPEAITIEEVAYQGWNKCYRISNGSIEIIVSGSFGPRILHASLIGGKNQFHLFEDTLGQVPNDNRFHPYGGHRLWHAPEDRVRTYQHDNIPPKITLKDISIVASKHEDATGMTMEIEVSLLPGQPAAVITHRMTNTTLWPIELAPWSLSMMAQGGVCIAPLPERRAHGKDLLPSGTLVLWPYSFMNDARWTWGKQFVMLRQDPALGIPQKCGLQVHEGWAAYAREKDLFVKFFDYDPQAIYPDMNSNFETFCGQLMLEVESLGPLTNLQPQATIEHVEKWFLATDVPMPANEDDVMNTIVPRVADAKRRLQIP